MYANKEAASSSSSRDARAEKSVHKLSVKEFRERFCIPNGVLVELMDGEVVAIEKLEDNAIFLQRSNSTLGSGSPFRRCSRNSFTSLRFHQLTSTPI